MADYNADSVQKAIDKDKKINEKQVFEKPTASKKDKKDKSKKKK